MYLVIPVIVNSEITYLSSIYWNVIELKALFNNVFIKKNLSCMSLQTISVFDTV